MEVLIGKSSINGLFSMAMLNNQRVKGTVGIFEKHWIAVSSTSCLNQESPLEERIGEVWDTEKKAESETPILAPSRRHEKAFASKHQNSLSFKTWRHCHPASDFRAAIISSPGPGAVPPRDCRLIGQQSFSQLHTEAAGSVPGDQ